MNMIGGMITEVGYDLWCDLQQCGMILQGTN
jgi:hypothetical protein